MLMEDVKEANWSFLQLSCLCRIGRTFGWEDKPYANSIEAWLLHVDLCCTRRCLPISAPNLFVFFFSYSLFSLHSTAARLTPFPFTSAGQIGRKGLLPAAMILMADEIASCCACLERSVTYVTRLCMPIFPRRTVVRNGYCKETEYSWKFIYIRSTYYPGHSCWCKPKKCQQQLTPHFLSSASIILFPFIIPLHLLQAVPLPVALWSTAPFSLSRPVHVEVAALNSSTLLRRGTQQRLGKTGGTMRRVTRKAPMLLLRLLCISAIIRQPRALLTVSSRPAQIPMHTRHRPTFITLVKPPLSHNALILQPQKAAHHLSSCIILSILPLYLVSSIMCPYLSTTLLKQSIPFLISSFWPQRLLHLRSHCHLILSLWPLSLSIRDWFLRGQWMIVRSWKQTVPSPLHSLVSRWTLISALVCWILG